MWFADFADFAIFSVRNFRWPKFYEKLIFTNNQNRLNFEAKLAGMLLYYAEGKKKIGDNVNMARLIEDAYGLK